MSGLSTAKLDALARAVITALELASTQKSARLDTDRITQTIDHRAAKLPQRIEAPHLQYLARYRGCNTDEERRLVITEALHELRGLRYSQRGVELTRKTKEWRLAIATDSRPNHVVSHVFDVSETSVRRMKGEYAATGTVRPTTR